MEKGKKMKEGTLVCHPMTLLCSLDPLVCYLLDVVGPLEARRHVLVGSQQVKVLDSDEPIPSTTTDSTRQKLLTRTTYVERRKEEGTKHRTHST
jgi:hypothetical protein